MLFYLLIDGTESHARRNDEDAIPWSSEEEDEEDNDDDHIGGNERAIEDEESDRESAAEIESEDEDEDDARVPPSGRHEIQSDDEDAELEMDLEFLENHFKANQTAAKHKASDLSPSDDEESAPQQNTDDIDAADEEQIEGQQQQQQQKKTNPRNLEPLDKFADDNEDEHFEDVDEMQPAAAAPKEAANKLRLERKCLFFRLRNLPSEKKSSKAANDAPRFSIMHLIGIVKLNKILYIFHIQYFSFYGFLGVIH